MKQLPLELVAYPKPTIAAVNGAAIGVGVEALWASLTAGRSPVVPRDLLVDVGRPVHLPMAAMPPVEALPPCRPPSS